ncbi:MAG: superfamily II DNA or RNA helicase, partial [Saprospiraceae bacterium]
MKAFQEFRTKFKTLADTEKKILKVLTILYEPINQMNAVQLLKKCEVSTDKRTHFYPKDMREMKNQLTKTGWLVSDIQSRLVVNPKYEEYIMRLAILDDGFQFWLKQIRDFKTYKVYFSPVSFEATKRELRLAIYMGEIPLFTETLRNLDAYYHGKWDLEEFIQNVFLPFDSRWFSTYKPEIQLFAINHLVTTKAFDLEKVEELVTFMKESDFLKAKNGSGSQIRSQLNLVYAFQGKTKEMAEVLKLESNEMSGLQRVGWMNFLLGQYDTAVTSFDKAMKLMRKQASNRNAHFPNISGVFHALSILAQRGPDHLKKIQTYHHQNHKISSFEESFNYLKATAYFQLNQIGDMREIMDTEPTSKFDALIWAMAKHWTQTEISEQNLYLLEQYYKDALKNGYEWLAMEFAGVLSRLSLAEPVKKNFDKEWLRLQKKLGIKSMLDIVPIIEKWERSLEALLNIKTKKKRGKAGGADGKAARIIWLINFDNQVIQPKEQTMTKSGGWSKGRNVALQRFKEEGILSATDQDNQVKKAVKMYSQGYYGQKDYAIEYGDAMQLLVGHPLLFLMESPSVSVELSEKEPELIVEEKEGDYILKFEEEFKGIGTYIMRETPTRYTILNVNETHQEINQLLENGQLHIPKKAKKQVIEAIGNLSAAVTVHSAVGEKAKDVPTVKADSTTYVHLLPLGDGFKLEFFVKPFKNDPPYFKPGKGRDHVIAEVGGVRTQAKRSLETESTNADWVESLCPSFAKVDGYNQEWQFDEIVDCLNVLLELEPLKKDKKVVIEYPKGEKLKISGQASFANLSMSIKKKRDWFAMDGELKIDGKKIMGFRQLLEAASNSDMPFVQVSDTEFLALTQEMQRKLQEINSLIHKNKGSLDFHPLAAPVLEDFTDLLDDLKVDAAWKDQVQRMSEARDVNPEVASTFKATLRDYQQEGFRWLTQLAHWGVGACLADDMGLGKTIQGLALLLNRAKDGPALVVAPASVARNWLREAEKFAPTLNAILFGGGNRKKVVDELKPFDLLICSYGLMQQEGELLATVQFNTIILDEAQAIKNRSTKRSKAAMGLQSNFKVLTTGTPIENHLGELWNLFNFLNPGLLGSAQFFNDNYALPIEKNNDKEVRQQLKRLIQPFILRRRKNDVLHELPAKTEVTLMVELSEEERAFYEALRQKAVENIEALEEESGKKRFQVLAELMKLRQACCHPKMVMPSSTIPSSKLELFGETILELLENGHKALVFSQFVKHLKLVEAFLKKQNISYQYLDGSTPMKRREDSINAFQGGEGDVFLISLKAGGVGLNLTAADYVIHLDPWWNPAVEDQASDRAHRIGQKRPVTIYRLVAEDTIEEKIVKLHGEKRDLADSLLEGTEASAKLSA